jgi:hypothetical protein
VAYLAVWTLLPFDARRDWNKAGLDFLRQYDRFIRAS